MKKQLLLIAIITPILFTSCAQLYQSIAHQYEEKISNKNAQEKVNKIVELIKDAESTGKETLEFKSKEVNECGYYSTYKRFPNQNLGGRSYYDLDKLIKEKFFVHLTETSKCDISSPNRDSCIIYIYQVGNGGNRISYKVKTHIGRNTSCANNTSFSYRYYLEIASYVPKKVSQAAFFQQEITAKDEQAFKRGAKAIAGFRKWNNYDYQNAIGNYNGMKAESRERVRKYKEKTANMWARQRGKSNTKNTTKNYVQYSTNTPKRGSSVSTGSSFSLKTKSNKQTKVSYYLGNVPSNYSGAVSKCFTGGKSIVDYQKQYTNECLRRYSNSHNGEDKYHIGRECGTQGSTKAKNIWHSKYSSKYNKPCPTTPTKKSSGKIIEM